MMAGRSEETGMSYSSDFVLSIDGDESDGFYIRAVREYRVGPNVNKHRVPGTPLKFDAARLLDIDRLSKVQENIALAIRHQSHDARAIREYGIELFAEVFKEIIRNEFEHTRQLLGGRGLRIRLHLPSCLQTIPWEIMHFPSDTQQTFLCLTNNLALVRLRPGADVGLSVTMQLPLQVLVVVGSPLDHSPINSRDEVSRLLQALAGLLQSGKATVDFVQGPDTYARMLQKMRATRYSILHYIGHSGDASGPLRLVFEDRQRRGRAVQADMLFQRFDPDALPNIVLLNTCEGASPSAVTSMTGVAESLIGQGVSAVIAHQFEISDEAAVVFTQRIYEGLAESVPLEEAVTAARNEVEVEYPIEALTPVIFLHNVSSGQFLMQPSRQPGLDVSALLERAGVAAAEGRWSEAASYAREARLTRPGSREAAEFHRQAEQQEVLDIDRHRALYQRARGELVEALRSCHRYLDNPVAQERPPEEREEMTRLKGVLYLRLAGEAEQGHHWAAAVARYEEYREDPIFTSLPERERNFVECLGNIARAGTGFRDPWLRWRE
jgi:hypothetical protein